VSLLWSHFVHWHNAVEGEVHTKVIVSNDRLLEEVHRMANLWRTYWAIYTKCFTVSFFRLSATSGILKNSPLGRELKCLIMVVKVLRYVYLPI